MRARRATMVMAGALGAFGLLMLSVIGAGPSGASAARPATSAGRHPVPVCATQPAGAQCDAKVEAGSSGAPLASAAPAGLTPTQLQHAYGLVGAAALPNTQTVGVVVAFDDPDAEADLATASTTFGLPACTTANGCFSKVDQNGGTNLPTSDQGWSLEADLDLQTIHAAAPKAHILLVEAKSAGLLDLMAAESYATSHATEVNNSWGSPEIGLVDKLFDPVFSKAIPITVATGDDGFGVQWPSSNPFVTAVGGTTLQVDASGNRLSETAWSGTGSGCSSFERKPSWQHDTGCTHRSVADVSADADPATGMSVFDSFGYKGSSGWFVVGGTSLASPIIAATYALAGNAGLAQLFALRAYLVPGALHDVTTGSNGTCSPAYLCTAGTGYDGPTGLGSPNGVLSF
jgi:subtilase family serine protease